MFARLNAVLIAALIAAPALADQPNGRDSVYTGAEASRSQSAQVKSAPPLGRDSVYAIGAKPSAPVTANVTFRLGRA